MGLKLIISDMLIIKNNFISCRCWFSGCKQQQHVLFPSWICASHHHTFKGKDRVGYRTFFLMLVCMSIWNITECIMLVVAYSELVGDVSHQSHLQMISFFPRAARKTADETESTEEVKPFVNSPPNRFPQKCIQLRTAILSKLAICNILISVYVLQPERQTLFLFCWKY